MARGCDRSSSEPNTVVIGGGTGLSTMLRGLKTYTSNLTAVVAVSDDGGGSGVLRSELGIPPPGDIRNCMQALSNAEPILQQLLDYRFTEGSLKGQSFGNLFLAAMHGISNRFDEAVMRMGQVLSLTGRVLPVSTTDIQLKADFSNGATILGESSIAKYKSDTGNIISRIQLVPEDAPALPEVISAIGEAELLIIGPGSLYTSIIPNLLTQGVTDAIIKAKAIKVYVLNVMTQDGETENYTASDHIRALFSHSSHNLVDYCLINNTIVPSEVCSRYEKQGAAPPQIDMDEIVSLGVKPVFAPVANTEGNLARHHSDHLAQALMQLFQDKSPTRIY